MSTSDETALERAAEVDKKIASGKKISELAIGVRAIKDNMCIKGQPCTAASKMLENFIAPYNATVIEN